MNEPEKFLERWSRRKREATEEAVAPSKPKESETEKTPEPTAAPVAAEADKPFDLDSLPSLESITAETDVRGFLQPGVPADLKREALRRAWSADPGIRDFIGLSENSWDFNDPTAMAGFGPIEPSEVARLMAQFVLTPPPEEKLETSAKAETPREPEAASAAELASVAEAPTQSDDPKVPAIEADAAPQKDSDALPTIKSRVDDA